MTVMPERQERRMQPTAAHQGRRQARLMAAAWLLAASLLGAFLPAAHAAESQDRDGFAITIQVKDNWPPIPVTDLEAFPGSEGQALLQWHAPGHNENGPFSMRPVYAYDIRVATFSVLDLGGSHVQWFDRALPFVSPPPPLLPGSLQSALTGLEPGTTYYFGLKSADAEGNGSGVDLRTKDGTNQAQVGVRGIAAVTDLFAQPGTAIGTIDLAWSEPNRIGAIAPTSYDVRASSAGQISTAAEFASAKALSQFSPSTLPAEGQPGRRVQFTLTGLTPSATYYFAVRMQDSGAPAFTGFWSRSVSANLNPGNWAVAKYLPIQPDAITNLSALQAGVLGDVELTWTAPVVPSGVPVDHYVVKYNTASIADLGGDTTAWFNLFTSTTVILPGAVAGSSHTLFIPQMDSHYTYYFAAKSVDILGRSSLIDVQAASVAGQVKIKPFSVGNITDLAAAPGAASGDVQLTWTEPPSANLHAPARFVVKVATGLNIFDDAGFAAARPLAAFSGSTPPEPSYAEAAKAFVVTGLTPFTTYYFAVRLVDASDIGNNWNRSAGNNASNWSAPKHLHQAPDAVTDLSALAGAGYGEVALSWTAPRNRNFTTLSRYEVRYATYSVGALASDTTAWFDLTWSSATTLAPARAPSSRESLVLTGLAEGELYFFMVKAVDQAGDFSQADDASYALQAQARPKGIAGVTDLRASPNGASGSIDLAWTEPGRGAAAPPERYSIRVSTLGNLSTDAEFNSALLLASFSPTPLPAPGQAAAERTLTVTGLTPFTTYYFALRAEDSALPVNRFGRWSRAGGLNASNWALPQHLNLPPDAVTDLTAQTGTGSGEVALSWTAPRNRNFTALSHYVVHYATTSAAELGGDTTAWFNLTLASATTLGPAKAPGSRETLTLTALSQGELFFFMVKAVDLAGDASQADDQAYGLQAQARARGIAGVTDLRALPGAASGDVALSWTEPGRAGTTTQARYTLKASTSADIADDAAFAAAQVIAVSMPAPGVSSSSRAFTLTGLTPFTTYYFALRTEDPFSLPPFAGRWLKDAGRNLNLSNWSVPTYIRQAPDAVTDLTALAGSAVGSVDLAWTAPRNRNFTTLSHYVVRFATYSAAQLAGDTTAWFDQTWSSATTLAPVKAPGALETLTLTGLEPGELFFFMVRAVDLAGELAPADAQAYALQAQARAKGIAGVTDLTASPNGVSGAVDLSWTEPGRAQTTAPERYAVKVSTLGQISTDAEFASALPLSAFSATAVPAPGAPTSRRVLTVLGLDPFTTHYFALRAEDSGALAGRWLRNEAVGRNAANFTVPQYAAFPPESVTDLSAVTGTAAGTVSLSWTAPRNRNYAAIARYELRYATYSVAALSGDTTAWFNLTWASATTLAPAKAPGALESLALTGLDEGALVFFMVKSVDVAGSVSYADARSYGPQAQARAKGIAPVSDLRAQPGEASGSVALTWTEPGHAGTTLPENYAVRISTVGNISNDAEFAAARPLSDFSPSDAPAPALSASSRTLQVQGLQAFTTYYFALRLEDSSAFAGAWRRDAANNPANFSAPKHLGNPPDAITDLSALQGSGEGEVALSWTAPRNQNFAAIARYQVYYAAVPAAQLGGVEAWSVLATTAALSPARAPGARETLSVGGLVPYATYYFMVKSVDAAGDVSPADARSFGLQANSKARNLAPAVPTGLRAYSELNKARVVWNELSGAGKGPDFLRYRLYRSTEEAGVFVFVASTTETVFTDAPLKAYTTFYFRVSAEDREGLESALSSTNSVVPFTIPPMEPFGVHATGDANNVTLHWSPTTRFSDGTPFTSTAPPATDELVGYYILRATHPCAPFTLLDTHLLAANGAAELSHTDATNGDAYYYQVESYNSVGVSTTPLIITGLGDHAFYLDDCASRVVIPKEQTSQLLKGTNGYEQDIRISRHRLPQQVGGKVLQAVEFVPMLGGVTPLKDFRLAKPVPVMLHFVTQAGRPVPHTGMLSAAECRAQAGTLAAAEDLKNLGMFWNNGVEFKKLYGKVDAAEQTVTVETVNLGQFQVRSIVREAGVTFDLSNITSRIFTPNGDGKNDVVLMRFDNPNRSAVEGKIFDLRGAFVATMQAGPDPNTLMWDGRMNGRTVTSGVYLYQVTGDGKTFNGTVVVAR